MAKHTRKHRKSRKSRKSSVRKVGTKRVKLGSSTWKCGVRRVRAFGRRAKVIRAYCHKAHKRGKRK